MVTLTVHIDNEKAGKRSLNKSEKAIYKRLKTSFKEIKSHSEGKIELRDARELLSEL